MNKVNSMRFELEFFLSAQRSKALRKQNMRKVRQLTMWIIFIHYHATTLEVSEYYCEYWNNHVVAIKPLVQLEMF